MKIQKPTGKPRARLSASVLDSIDREIRRTSRRFGVSRSFVAAVAMAQGLGIEIDTYHTNTQPNRTFRIYRGGRRSKRSA